nr:DDE-type integrase/transposase/recombinase [Aestuariivirga sp. YIM B02566]
MPGLPGSKSNIQSMADREGWKSAKASDGEPLARRRKGPGGGFEYHISVLPASARVAMKSEELKVDVIATPTTEIAPPPPVFTEKNMLRRDSRLALLSLADAHYSANLALGRAAADYDFAGRYNQGLIEIPGWIKQQIAYASGRSIKRWRMLRDAGHWHQIGNGVSKRGRKSTLGTADDGEIAIYISGLLVAQPHLTADHIRDLVEAKFAPETLPSIRSFQRYISTWKSRNGAVVAKLTNPDGFRNSIRLSGSGAYSHIRRLNELWEIDASPADVLLKDGRYSIYVAVDVWSRRMMTYVTRTPRTEAALLLIRRAIIAWGVPEQIRTDNGADFTSYHFKRAVHSLGIGHDITNPFSPEEKGIVERHIGTLQRGLMPLLPGFIGHNVQDRKQIEARRAFAARLGESDAKTFCVDLDHDELQRAMDAWCTDKFAHSPHKGLDGQTPFLRAQAYNGALRKIENLRALDLLLAPVAGSDGYRTVTKQGIRLDYGYYIAHELMAGAKVYCRQDPEDLGRLYIFESETGAFLAEAICPERSGVNPRQLVAAARAAQQDLIRERTQEIRREARRIKPRDMIDDVLGLAKSKNRNIMPFPKPADTHSSPALDEAASALSAPIAMPGQLPIAQATTNVVSLPETAKQRFRRAIAIQEAMTKSDAVDADAARWLTSYVQSAEFKAHIAMFEDFGREWLEEA